MFLVFLHDPVFTFSITSLVAMPGIILYGKYCRSDNPQISKGKQLELFTHICLTVAFYALRGDFLCDFP